MFCLFQINFKWNSQLIRQYIYVFCFRFLGEVYSNVGIIGFQCEIIILYCLALNKFNAKIISIELDDWNNQFSFQRFSYRSTCPMRNKRKYFPNWLSIRMLKDIRQKRMSSQWMFQCRWIGIYLDHRRGIRNKMRDVVVNCRFRIRSKA